MEGHHINYKTGETVELTKGQHLQIHLNTCCRCHKKGFNLLVGSINITPKRVLKNIEDDQTFSWHVLCDKCWLKVLKVPVLRIDYVYKATWTHGKEFDEMEDGGVCFVREHIRRYPRKMFKPKHDPK